MCQEHKKLRLIGCSTESIWTPRSKSNMLTPKKQLDDMLTKASCSRDEWNHLLRMFKIMSFSMFSCGHFSNFISDPIGKQSAMSKRGQEATSSEGSQMAKPKPTVPAKARPVNLVSRSPWSARENPPQNLGYLVDPGTTQSPEVESYQLRKKLKNSNPWKQEVSSYSTNTRKLVRAATSRTEGKFHTR